MEVTVGWNGPNLLAKARHFELDIARAPDADGNEPLESGEMLLVALGMCTAGTLRGYAKRNEFPVRDLRVTLQAEKVSAPTRYDNIQMRVDIEGDLTEEQRQTFFRVASSCTIGNTLRQATPVTVTLAQADAVLVEQGV